jgi:hypothetical protein
VPAGHRFWCLRENVPDRKLKALNLRVQKKRKRCGNTAPEFQNGVTVQPAIGADIKEELAVAADATRSDAAPIQRLPLPASLSMAGEGRDTDWQFRNRTGIAQSNCQRSSETE